MFEKGLVPQELPDAGLIIRPALKRLTLLITPAFPQSHYNSVRACFHFHGQPHPLELDRSVRRLSSYHDLRNMF